MGDVQTTPSWLFGSIFGVATPRSTANQGRELTAAAAPGFLSVQCPHASRWSAAPLHTPKQRRVPPQTPQYTPSGQSGCCCAPSSPDWKSAGGCGTPAMTTTPGASSAGSSATLTVGDNETRESTGRGRSPPSSQRDDGPEGAGPGGRRTPDQRTTRRGGGGGGEARVC